MKRLLLYACSMLIACCLFAFPASPAQAAIADKIIAGEKLTADEQKIYDANKATIEEVVSKKRGEAKQAETATLVDQRKVDPIARVDVKKDEPVPAKAEKRGEEKTLGDAVGGLFRSLRWLLFLVPIVLAGVCYRLVLRIFGIVMIPDDSIGRVTKKFVLLGSNKELPPGKIIALKGEAGLQADTLAPGLHFWLWPWQYKIDIVEFFVVPAGKIGIVESCDGKPMPDGRILACHVDCDNFQDARAFLESSGERGVQTDVIPPGTWRINTLVFSVRLAEMTIVPQGKIGIVEALDGKPLSGGRIIGRHVECNSFQDAQAFMVNNGERGPQMTVIPQGQYRINPVLFKVEMAEVTDISDNMVGIITTKEGKPLASGEIAGSSVDGHNMFQDPQSFVDKGGNKGLQEQVLLAGRYFINPRFATVEMVEMTKVSIATVGVVISYVGAEGVDVTGDGFKHGNIVHKGQKGVWVDSLDPGKYPVNPFTHKVESVSTANIVLNWATGKTEAHNLDKELSTITVRSLDGFTLKLDVSQIIHIPRADAPKVIARFGSVANMVTQVLEPIIGNYFRNSAQKSDAIDFLNARKERQDEARVRITEALGEYDVVAVDTLIGDIIPPAELMKTLTDRKIAEQEKITYNTQREAQETRKQLQQAQAQADTQPQVVAAERSVEIAKFAANAAIEKATGDAQSKTINAEADAKVLILVGDAEGQRVTAVGTAEAEVIKKKTDAMDQEKYALVEMARAFSTSGFKLVPDVVAGGGSGADGGSIISVLMAGMLKDSLERKAAMKPATEPKKETVVDIKPAADLKKEVDKTK